MMIATLVVVFIRLTEINWILVCANIHFFIFTNCKLVSIEDR